MRNTIGIVSGKGGVGKTTFVTNLGIALGQRGADVLVVDGDVMMSNLSLQLGTFQSPTTLEDVMKGDVRLSQAKYAHLSGMKFIPAALSIDYRKQRSSHQLNRVLKRVNGIVLVDAPPGLGNDTMAVLNCVSQVLIVTLPEYSALADAKKTIQVARHTKTKILGIVVNRNRGSYELSNQDIELLCGEKVVANIPEDESVRESAFMGLPVVEYDPDAPASLIYQELAASLLGEEFKPSRSFWGRLLGRSRKKKVQRPEQRAWEVFQDLSARKQ